MKKFLVVLTLTLSTVVFTCGCSKSNTEEKSTETEAIKTSSNNQIQEEKSEDEAKTVEASPTDATSASEKDTTEESTKSTEDTSKDKTKASLYLPNENVDGFDIAVVDVKDCPTDLVKLLVEMDALPKGSEILSFDLEEANETATLDMSSEYGDQIFQMGTSGEYMLVGSLVNTFIKYYDLKNITLKVEGENLESGHNVYDTPIEFYEDQTGIIE